MANSGTARVFDHAYADVHSFKNDTAPIERNDVSDQQLIQKLLGSSNFRDEFEADKLKGTSEISGIYHIPSNSGILKHDDIKTHNRRLTRISLVSKENELFEQRNVLIDKEISLGLSQVEERRLKYIEWQLDRIEDAQIGDHIDQLESLIEQKEFLARGIRDFSETVKKLTARKKNK